MGNSKDNRLVSGGTLCGIFGKFPRTAEDTEQAPRAPFLPAEILLEQGRVNNGFMFDKGPQCDSGDQCQVLVINS